MEWYKWCLFVSGFFYWLRRYSVCLQCGRLRFDPWVGKILCRRKWQATPVLLTGKFHGRRSLVSSSPWDCKESHTWLSNSLLILSTILVPFDCNQLMLCPWASKSFFHKLCPTPFLPVTLARSACVLTCQLSGQKESYTASCLTMLPKPTGWTLQHCSLHTVAWHENWANKALGKSSSYTETHEGWGRGAGVWVWWGSSCHFQHKH